MSVRHLGFYQTGKWKQTSQFILRDRNFICEQCNYLVKKNNYVVHHIIELTVDNYIDPLIAYGTDNLMLVCKKCHSKLHSKEKLTYEDKENEIKRKLFG